MDTCHAHYVFSLTDLRPFPLGEPTTRPCIFQNATGPCVLGTHVDACPEEQSTAGRQLSSIESLGLPEWIELPPPLALRPPSPPISAPTPYRRPLRHSHTPHQHYPTRSTTTSSSVAFQRDATELDFESRAFEQLVNIDDAKLEPHRLDLSTVLNASMLAGSEAIVGDRSSVKADIGLSAKFSDSKFESDRFFICTHKCVDSMRCPSSNVAEFTMRLLRPLHPPPLVLEWMTMLARELKEEPLDVPQICVGVAPGADGPMANNFPFRVDKTVL